MPQVSVVRQQSVKKSNEETVSKVDSSRSRSSLVDKPEGSISIARDTTFDSAIGCSTSNGCDCVGCSSQTGHWMYQNQNASNHILAKKGS